MAGISGAALADIGALGNIQIKAMKEQGYKEEVAASITVAAATLGPIFPPAFHDHLRQRGGSVRHKAPHRRHRPGTGHHALPVRTGVVFRAEVQLPPRDACAAVAGDTPHRARAVPALATPVLLVCGLLFGWFGPTELAAFTVFYSLFLGSVVYQELTWERCWRRREPCGRRLPSCSSCPRRRSSPGL